MYARIELEDAIDVDGSLSKFQSWFPKIEQIFFPPSKSKGAAWYGFSFNHSDPLLDWMFISTWCKTINVLGDNYDDNCAMLRAAASAEKALQGAVPVLAQQIRKGREFGYELEFWLNKRKSRFRIEMSQVDKCLVVSWRFDKLLATDKATKAAMYEAWQSAQAKLPVLKMASLEASKKFSCSVPEPDEKIQMQNNELRLFFTTPSTIRTGMMRVLQLATEIEGLFEGVNYSLSLELLPSDMPTVTESLRNVFGNWQYVHFDGAYHASFHPDQVLKKFPREGYWLFPLFTARIGRDEFELVYAYLVQTPRERFIELVFDEPSDLKKLNMWLKGKCQLQPYDGPDEKRWNLHKLRKKQ